MIKETNFKQEIMTQLDKAFSNFFLQLSEIDEQQINEPPGAGSWSAAQVADHVGKSNHSIAKSLALKGTLINRNPFERVAELKKIFLDFTTSLKSPDFILPGNENRPKRQVLDQFILSVNELKRVATRSELLEMINHPAFGDITKFEILHFVVYHTQRHLYQMEKITRCAGQSKSNTT